MNQHLIVKNFGAIKELDLKLKPIMVFIGKQSTGKSTIAKLIAICRSTGFVFGKKTLNENLEHYNISSFLKPDTYIKFHSDFFSFEYINGKGSYNRNKKNKYYLLKKKLGDFEKKYPDYTAYHREGLIKELEDLAPELEKHPELAEASYEIEVSPNPELQPLLDKLNSLIKEVELRKEYRDLNQEFGASMAEIESFSEYIPAERSFVSLTSSVGYSVLASKIVLPNYIKDFGAAFDAAKAENKEINIDFLGVKYSFENGIDKVYHSEAEFITLSESASGLQSAIPMIMVLNHKSASLNKSILLSTFIIEEPELNLFPTAQKDLIKIIIERGTTQSVVPDKRGELIITTHSPYILASLNNLLFANKIAEQDEAKKEEIRKIIPEGSWIKQPDFGVYEVENGILKNLLKEDTGMISQTALDYASNEIMNEFNGLMKLFRMNTNDKSN